MILEKIRNFKKFLQIVKSDKAEMTLSDLNMEIKMKIVQANSSFLYIAINYT